MSTPKPEHTAGEWSINLMSNGRVFVTTGDVDICELFNPYPTASESGNPESMLKRKQSNANLIASAPKLLAALQAVESQLDRWGRDGAQRGPNGRDADWPTLLTQVHDAINSATK